jgi:hypothetical protein
MKTMLIVTMGLAALALGLDKVRNEHAMTRQYERQAAALETIASELRPAAQRSASISAATAAQIRAFEARR